MISRGVEHVGHLRAKGRSVVEQLDRALNQLVEVLDVDRGNDGVADVGQVLVVDVARAT